MTLRRLFLVAVWLALASCSSLNPPSNTPAPLPTATNTPPATPEITRPAPGPLTLQIWLPPQFDPAANTPGGEVLQRQLDEFTSRRPDVRIEVRIKSMDGPGGLLDSLTTASAAAPLALPDLIALPRPMLETAAIKGLLHPFDDLLPSTDESDWFPYARQLARLQDAIFGLPFAGDAMVMVYRNDQITQPPVDLGTSLSLDQVLAFPAADPQALYTLALYQSAGGAILDEQGRPYLDEDTLYRLLAFYQQAALSELTPFWLTQFQTDAQAWEAFEDKRANMAITWISRYLAQSAPDVSAAPLPTLDGARFTLATGWVWALASPNPENQKLSVQLALYLTESGFLSDWSIENGVLPPRISSLEAWEDSALQDLARYAILSARMLPSTDVITTLALPLERAAVQVLKQESDPETAARQAVGSLAGP